MNIDPVIDDEDTRLLRTGFRLLFDFIGQLLPSDAEAVWVYLDQAYIENAERERLIDVAAERALSDPRIRLR